MKNILIVLTVLAMASTASAALELTVDSSVAPDTVMAYQSDIVVVGMFGDGQTSSGQEFYLNITGPVSVDLTSVTSPWNPDGVGVLDLGDGLYFVDLAKPVVPIPDLPAELLTDGIALHLDGEGQAVITLSDGTFTPHDTLTIEQIPEPITLALMGIGGLFLRRRK